MKQGNYRRLGLIKSQEGSFDRLTIKVLRRGVVSDLGGNVKV